MILWQVYKFVQSLLSVVLSIQGHTFLPQILHKNVKVLPTHLTILRFRFCQWNVYFKSHFSSQIPLILLLLHYNREAEKKVVFQWPGIRITLAKLMFTQ